MGYAKHSGNPADRRGRGRGSPSSTLDLVWGGAIIALLAAYYWVISIPIILIVLAYIFKPMITMLFKGEKAARAGAG